MSSCIGSGQNIQFGYYNSVGGGSQNAIIGAPKDNLLERPRQPKRSWYLSECAHCGNHSNDEQCQGCGSRQKVSK